MYGKIFEDIFYSSLMFNMGWQSVYVFSSMIVIADKYGIVRTDPRALYRLIGMEADQKVDFKNFMEFIAELEQPDQASNIPECEGKRIIPLSELDDIDGDRGWLIINYDYYLNKGSKNDRNDYQKNYYENITKAKRKANKINVSTAVNICQHGSTDSIHIDIDKDIDIDKIKTIVRNEFARFWDQYPKKRNRKKCQDIWIRKKLDSKIDLLISDIRNRLINDDRWKNGFIVDPERYLTNERWNDEIEKSKPKTESRITDWVRWGQENDIPPRIGETNDQYIQRLQKVRK